MTPQTPDLENENEPGGEGGSGENANIRQLREKAKRTDTAEQAATAAKRELAFYKAGLDPSKDPKLTYFISGYSGELEVDAIVKEATEAGFITPPAEGSEAPGEAEQTAVEQTAAARIAQATGGGAITAPGVDHKAEIAKILASPGGNGRQVAAYLERNNLPVAEGSH